MTELLHALAHHLHQALTDTEYEVHYTRAGILITPKIIPEGPLLSAAIQPHAPERHFPNQITARTYLEGKPTRLQVFDLTEPNSLDQLQHHLRQELNQ